MNQVLQFIVHCDVMMYCITWIPSIKLLTLSPSRRLIPSNSIKAEVCKVVSCLSSSLFSFGASRHQVTTNPKELFPLWPSKIHFKNTLGPDSSATISGTDGDGACLSVKKKREFNQLNYEVCK